MDSDQRGRKAADSTPSESLPHIPEFQHPLEPGTTDFAQPTRSRTRKSGVVVENVVVVDRSKTTTTNNNKSPNPRAREWCNSDAEELAHQHQDPAALAHHLRHFCGHSWAEGFIEECGVVLINLGLKEMSETEGVRSRPKWLVWKVRELKKYGGDPVPPPSERQPAHEEWATREQEYQDASLPTVTGDPNAGVHELWKSVLAELKLQVPKPMFETWLKHLSGHDLTGDTLTIAAPTSFAVEWVERRQYHAIVSIVSKLRGRETELAFALAGPEAEPPSPDTSQGAEAADLVHASVNAAPPRSRLDHP